MTAPRWEPGPLGRAMLANLSIARGTAVVVTVDMQRDYLDQAVGTNLVDSDWIPDVVGSTVSLLTRARARGVPIVHAYVTRREAELVRGFGKSRYATAGRAAGLSQNARGNVAHRLDRLEGSERAQLLPALDGGGDVHVSTKKTMDCFLGTDLDLLLRRALRADTVVLCGINTDTCVYSTAFTCSNLGFQTVVAVDCVASVRGVDAHRKALDLMSGSFAWAASSDDILARIGEPGPIGGQLDASGRTR
jgi:nicotinamidase-related amidase